MPEYLKERRLHLKLSVAEVAKRAGVSEKALKVLEEGAYHLLPPGVYVKGFLAQLAGLYYVDKETLISQYEIERNIQSNVSRKSYSHANKPAKWLEHLVITPKNLSFFSAAIFICATVIYIVWQVLAINKPPFLEIISPQNLSVIEMSVVSITGRTDPGVSLTVNAEPVFVDEEGRFQATLGISAGSKEIVVKAANRFFKTTSKVLTIIGQAKTAVSDEIAVRLELEALADVEIALKLDGAEKILQTFRAGEKKLFEAKRKILFSASDAGNVRVKVNGKNLGLLGRTGESLSDIPFFVESGNIK